MLSLSSTFGEGGGLPRACHCSHAPLQRAGKEACVGGKGMKMFLSFLKRGIAFRVSGMFALKGHLHLQVMGGLGVLF